MIGPTAGSELVSEWSHQVSTDSRGLRGGPYVSEERVALLDYCQSDVDALARLLPAMLPLIDAPRALLRGRYMAAAARMERTGIPVDADALFQLRENWGRIKGQLIAAVDAQYGVYVPVGQRTINPETTLGAAILHDAAEWKIDPHQLADAVDLVWREERGINEETNAARRFARQATGLTAHRIHAWEETGQDCSTYPRFRRNRSRSSHRLPGARHWPRVRSRRPG
jgi:hypothetical protein